MPAKKKRGESTNKTSTWQKDEDDVQAVIIADSFNVKFSPVTRELPRALMPLGNRVLIDYTIEYLLKEGVQEIIVFCCSLGEKIRDHVESKWVKNNPKSTIHCVMSSTADCISLGDALREIDREGLIRSDFILVPGDLLSNVKISAMIKEHKAKRKKEKNLVMTLLFREVNPGHFSRCSDDDVVMAIEQSSNRILCCQKSEKMKKFALPIHVLSNRKDIELRYDLCDCHISICSPQVAPLFTDNFDYQTIDDLIKGILTNEEILGDQVHSTIIPEGYSSRVNDLYMYNVVSLDFMNRWLYPVVPETSTCRYRRNNVYIENSVKIEKDCRFPENVIIGSRTSIDEATVISNSAVGSNCVIGKNVQIQNSFIWDNVVIEDGVSLTQTVVCSNCVIQRGAKIIDSILSFKVCIGSDIKLPPGSKISLVKPAALEEKFNSLEISELEQDNYDYSVVGKDGKGYAWHQQDDEDEVIPSLTGNDYETSSDESSDEDEESLPPTPPAELSNLHQFYLEVVENLRCGILENIAADNIALEVNASKFKFNISIQELSQTISKALLVLALKEETESKQEMVKELDKVITVLQPLLLKYFNSAEGQLHAILAVEEYFASRLPLGGILATYLHKMYDKDIFDEDIILAWYKTAPSATDFVMQDNFVELRKNPTLLKFIAWLETEDTDEDSD